MESDDRDYIFLPDPCLPSRVQPYTIGIIAFDFMEASPAGSERQQL
jgi:hypothetical protein